jgi:CheY-like chemotaxis protein
MDYLILPSAEAMITFFDSLSDAQQYPSVLVTDLNRPRMNGLQLIQSLRSKPEGEHLHIAVYSTSTLDSDKEMCLAAGANAFIVKPLSFAGYCQIAENLLAGLNSQASFRS